MLKNAFFLEKDVKNRLKRQEIRPLTPVGLQRKPPALLLPPTMTTLSSSFLALNAVYYLQKRTNFVSSKFLQLFFTSNSVVFVDRGRKNISCSRAKGTLATPLQANVRCCS